MHTQSANTQTTHKHRLAGDLFCFCFSAEAQQRSERLTHELRSQAPLSENRSLPMIVFFFFNNDAFPRSPQVSRPFECAPHIYSLFHNIFSPVSFFFFIILQCVLWRNSGKQSFSKLESVFYPDRLWKTRQTPSNICNNQCLLKPLEDCEHKFPFYASNHLCEQLFSLA